MVRDRDFGTNDEAYRVLVPFHSLIWVHVVAWLALVLYYYIPWLI